MARKKNRGKKAGSGGGAAAAGGTAAAAGVAPTNKPSTGTPIPSPLTENCAPAGEGTTNLLHEEIGVDAAGLLSTQEAVAACPRAAATSGGGASSRTSCRGNKAKHDQEAFLNEFETKASQVSTQTTISVPEVVEKVVEIEKVVEKEVKVMVEDPALKSKVEELVKENAELKTQVAEFQKSIPKVDDSKRVSELEEEVKSVNEKVSHYQKVLADTEELLRTLQASVESEEVTWNKKLSEKEHNIKQLTADKANLELQIGKLEGTLDKVRQAEEMDSQLKVLQEQLQKEEKEKALLQQQLQDAQEQLTKTATQGGSDEESIRELRLENEKLLSLVTVGQDESREQDQLIQQLQQELAAVKSASTNGPANEEQCQEDDNSRADTESLMSASSASVTDTNPSQVESKASAKKSKKKRKGILGKLIGKSSDP